MDVPWENISQHITQAIRFIKEALNNKGNVFVHCYAGVSRSASFVIAYLMMKENLSFFQAMKFVKMKRPNIFPNPGFLSLLLEYESTLNSQRLK